MRTQRKKKRKKRRELKELTFLCVQYVAEVFNSGMARSACVYSAEMAMDSAMEAVVMSGLTECPYDYNTQYSAWKMDPCCNLDLFVRVFLFYFH